MVCHGGESVEENSSAKDVLGILGFWSQKQQLGFFWLNLNNVYFWCQNSEDPRASLEEQFSMTNWLTGCDTWRLGFCVQMMILVNYLLLYLNYNEYLPITIMIFDTAGITVSKQTTNNQIHGN